MKYTARIRNNKTGEIRDCDMGELQWKGDSDLYWWREGNFSCGCNRGDTWARAGGDFDADYPCSEDFTVISVTLENNTVIPID